MAQNACVWVPRKGAHTFKKLKNQFGRNKAAEVFNAVRTIKFLNDFKDSLELDNDGIPTYESIIHNTVVQKHIGLRTIAEVFEKEYVPVSNSYFGVQLLIQDAVTFEKENPNFVAYVDKVSESQIGLRIEPKTSENKEMLKRQQTILALNNVISSTLRNAEIPVDYLSLQDRALGRAGKIEFKRAENEANGFTAAIGIANNIEGFESLSEEFAHLIVGISLNNPLVARSIEYLSKEQNAREVLGESYDAVADRYNNDSKLIAEEAAGQLLQGALIRKQQEINNPQPILKRFVKQIFSWLKKLNVFKTKNQLQKIMDDYYKLADSTLKSKVPLDKEAINRAKRIATLNSLTNDAVDKYNTLKKIYDRSIKASVIMENTSTEEGITQVNEKSHAKKSSIKYETAFKETPREQPLTLITKFIALSIQDLRYYTGQLKKIESMDTQNKFIVLRNILTVLQQYQANMKDLERLLHSYDVSPEILEDLSVFESSAESLECEIQSRLTYPGIKEKIREALDNKDYDEVTRIMKEESARFKLTVDEKFYESTEADSTKIKHMRTTTTIAADLEGEPFDENSPWKKPSTNIGTGIDTLIRDFFAGRIEERTTRTGTKYWVYVNAGSEQYLNNVYPNATSKALNTFVTQLQELKESFDRQNITIIPEDIVVSGSIETLDSSNRSHTIAVAGTIDLLGYNKNTGEYHLYDIKTHRSKLISDQKKGKWARQLSLYKQFLEDKYGIEISTTQIIPVKVWYETPLGANMGTANYEVQEGTNQLLINGEIFKGSNPKLEEIIDLDPVELNIQYEKLTGNLLGGIANTERLLNSIQATMGILKTSYSQLQASFEDYAMPSFIEFLRPFVGDFIAVPGKNGKIKQVSIESIISKVDGDVTLLQHWLTTMADNPDTFLQMYESVYKTQLTKARLNTIDVSQKIVALGKRGESQGITSYEWMFEEDKKTYINKEFNGTAYKKALKAKQDELNDKYGQNLRLTDPRYALKKQELNQWISDHNDVVELDNGKEIFVPKSELYPSVYSSLSQNEKAFYDEWMKLKASLDLLLGPNKTTLLNSIKIRKSNIERLYTGGAKEAYTAFAEKVKSATAKSFDDEYNYVKGMKGFSGEAVYKLPIYYISDRLDDKEAQDLSTDVIGTLVAYASMAYEYSAMKDIVNPLEIGREIAKSRVITATEGGKTIKERFFYNDQVHEEEIIIPAETSRFMETLNAFMESKIYDRKMKNEGTILGKDVNKLANLALKFGSSIQLGFNYLANAANALTGIAMTNIEVMSNEFFGVKELFEADSAYMANLPEYLGDIGQRVQNSKLSLFDDLFNIRMQFKTKQRNIRFLNKTIVTRLLGPGLQFLGQEAGDHWLYNRIGIAIAKRHKIKLTKDGVTKEVSVWDALIKKPLDPADPSAGHYLDLDGTPDFGEYETYENMILTISREIEEVSHHLFGVYDDESSIVARRYILGRFAMQYRDWLPSQFRHRFGKASSDLRKKGINEGFYRTTGNFTKQIYKECIKGEKSIREAWDSLENYQKANVRRCVTEVIQFLGLQAILFLLGVGGDDKESVWDLLPEKMSMFLKTSGYRLKTELGAQIPIAHVSELLKIINSPVAATSILEDLSNVGTFMWIPNWFDEIEEGRYKGMTEGEKAFLESPFSLWYKNFRKLNDMESVLKYYQ